MGRKCVTKGAVNLKTMWLPFLVFFQLYGTKIWFVDTIIVSSAFVVLMFSRHLRLSRFQLYFITLVWLFYIYMLLTQLASPYIDPYILGRYLRMILSALFLAVIVSAIRLRATAIKQIVGNLILLHGVVVVAQIVVPPLKEYMAPLVAFPKDMLAFRSFGLVGSYDMASLYICVGMVIFISRYMEKPKERYILSLLFLWGAGLFTGRTFMITGTFILLIAVVAIIWRSGLMTRVWVVIFSIGASVVFWETFGPFLLASMGLLEVGDHALKSNLGIEESYYIGTLGVMVRHIFLPSDPINLFLGGLPDPPSDNGYVRLIYTTGIIGLTWMLFAYIYMVSAVWMRRVLDRWVVVATIILILIYNVKMLMVGARGITELLLLLTYSAYSGSRGSLANSRQAVRRIVSV